MPVLTDEDRIESRTLKLDKIISAINHDLTLTSGENYEGEGGEFFKIEINRPFRINTVDIKKNDIKANCNRQKNRITTVGQCCVQDVYTKNNNCGYQVLKSLDFVTDVKPKQ